MTDHSSHSSSPCAAWCNPLQPVSALAEGLDRVVSRGLFQPQPLHDSVIVTSTQRVLLFFMWSKDSLLWKRLPLPGPGPIPVPCWPDTSLPTQTPGWNLAPRVTTRFGSLQVLLCVQSVQTKHSQCDPSRTLWAPLCGSCSLRQGQAFPSNTP